MDSQPFVPDSQSDSSDAELTTQSVAVLVLQQQAEKRLRRRRQLLEQLKPQGNAFLDLPTTRERRRAFKQRHVYTVDLAEQLGLSSEQELDSLSRGGSTDEGIVYMLNRKYTKLRKFYERLEYVGRHRFKKKNFDVYLEDFKKYQGSTLAGKTIYEASDEGLEDSDRKTLRTLLKAPLEAVETTDEETTSEDEGDDEGEDKTDKPESSLDRDEGIVLNTHRSKALVLEDSLGSSSSQAVQLSQPSQLTQSKLPPLNSSPPVSPVAEEMAEEMEEEVSSAAEELSSPVPVEEPSFAQPSLPIAREVRRRRHTFTQDHVFVADAATHLGLATQYLLNDMFGTGKSYDDIMRYLETVYRGKRAERKRKEIGYGPYSKATFKAWLDDERRRLDGRNSADRLQTSDPPDSQINAFIENDNCDLSDGDYVFPGEDDADQQEDRDLEPEPELDSIEASRIWDIPRDEPSQERNIDKGVFDIPSDNEGALDHRGGASSEPELPSSQVDDPQFVFRNHVYKKKTALHGVLPNSFLKVFGQQNASQRQYKSRKKQRQANIGPIVKGVARKRSAPRGSLPPPSEAMRQFLVSEDDDSDREEDPADYHRFTEEMHQPGPTIIDLTADPDDVLSSASAYEDSMSEHGSQDDGVGLDQYGMFIDEMKGDMDMYGSAEEDNHTGINYMLSRPEPSAAGVAPSRPRQQAHKRKRRRFAAQQSSSRYQKRRRVTSGYNPRAYQQATFNHHQHVSSSVPESLWLEDEQDVPRGMAFHSRNQETISTLRDISNIDEPTQAQSYPKQSSIQSKQKNSSSLGGYRTQRSRSAGPGTTSAKPKQTSKTESKTASKAEFKPDSKARKPIPRPLPWNKSKFQDFDFNRAPVAGTAQLEAVVEPVQADDAEIMEIPPEPVGGKQQTTARNVFLDTVEKLDRALTTSERSSPHDLDAITLKFYRTMQLMPKSIVNSKLIEESLKIDGDFTREENIVFEYNSVRFTLGEYVYKDSPQLLETLFTAILASFKNTKGFSKKTLGQLKKSLIKVIWLMWNLQQAGSPYVLKEVGRSLLRFVKKVKSTLTDEKLILLVLPYENVIIDVLHKFLRNHHDPEYELYEWQASNLRKDYIRLFCSMPPSKVRRYFSEKGEPTVYFESACLFSKFCTNPWQYVAGLAHNSGFMLPSVMNFLYFIQSQQSVLPDWEYFIQELGSLSSDKSPLHWKMTFHSIQKVINDLQWPFEEELLVKMYRLLSNSRFDNIGTQRATTLWYSSLPKSVLFSDKDGCLDMYLKFLVLYVEKYADPSRYGSLVEKLVPIAAIKTSTISLLKNRANLMLVMSYLFKKDFVGHFKTIFKALLRFKNPDSYRAALELLLLLSRCNWSQFQKLPMGILRGTLTKVVKAVNEGELNVAVVAESFKSLVDFFDTQLGQVVPVVDVACVLLKLDSVDIGSRISYVPNKILYTVRKILEMTGSEALQEIRTKLKSEFIQSLKSVILSSTVHNDPLKASCVSLWVYVSSRLRFSVGSLVVLDWPCFGNETLRSKFELPFYTALLNYYEPGDLRSHNDKFMTALLTNIPVAYYRFFHPFFVALVKQRFMQPYVSFKNGLLDPSNFTERDVQKYLQQITIKILARLVSEVKRPNADPKYQQFLAVFIKALDKEYIHQRNVSANFGAYKNYAMRVVRYLYTVVKPEVERVPEFMVLKRELSIGQTLASVSEQLELVSSNDELYLLLEAEYIKSIENSNFDTFKTELVDYCWEHGGFVDEVRRVSPLVPLAVLVVSHAELVISNRKHWVHLCNWFTIFKEVAFRTCSFTSTDLWYVVKVLTHLTKLSGTGEYPYNYYEDVTTTNVYLILERLNLALVGYEDRVDFVNSLDVLRGVDSEIDRTVDSDLFTLLSTPVLDLQIEKMITDKDAVFNRLLRPVTNPQTLSAAKEKRSIISKSVIESIKMGTAEPEDANLVFL